MGSNANRRPAAAAAAAAPAPPAVKKLKRYREEEDEDFSLPPASDAEGVIEDANFDEDDEDDDFDDSDSDSDGSDDELEQEVAAPAASSRNVEEEITRVLTPLGLGAFGTDVPFLDVLLGISAISQEHRAALSMFQQECLGDMSTGQLSQSLEPTDEFLTRTKEQEWASHDEEIDALWDGFVVDVVRLGEGAIQRQDLVKPSGPLRAVLTFFWHYPTWNTQKKAFGHVFDKTNQSLRFQDRKIGPNAWVRTHDRFPFRHPFVKGGVDWEAEYPNWDRIEARCLRLNKEMIRHSKIVFFIGQENHDSWQNFITLAPGDRVHQVQLGSSAFEGLSLPDHVFRAKPAFHTIKSSSGTVKQLVFSSYHSQYCINGSDTLRGAYMDLTWNAALDFAALDVRQYDTFTRGMGLNPKEPTRFRCCFVDPETEERCFSTRQYVKYLRKHWDACHGKVDGASWDESLVQELPRDVALALESEGLESEGRKSEGRKSEGRKPEDHKPRTRKVYTNEERKAAHKAAVLRRKEERRRANAVPVVKDRQRIGRRPRNLEEPRFRCHYVDPETNDQCTATYSTRESLYHMHFKVKHPDSEFKKNAVAVIKESKAEWNKSRAEPETVTTQKERKMAKGNARGAKSRAKLAELVTLQCNYCKHTTKNNRSNMKKHVEKHHPEVEYSSKTSFTKIENGNADSDKENAA